MKISDTKALPPQYERHETKAPKNGAHHSIEADSVRLSGVSGEIAGMSAQIAAEPHFDAAKVEAIKAAIRDGSLQVNPEAIADKLIASVAELLKKPH